MELDILVTHQALLLEEKHSTILHLINYVRRTIVRLLHPSRILRPSSSITVKIIIQQTVKNTSGIIRIRFYKKIPKYFRSRRKINMNLKQSRCSSTVTVIHSDAEWAIDMPYEVKVLKKQSVEAEAIWYVVLLLKLHYRCLLAQWHQ